MKILIVLINVFFILEVVSAENFNPKGNYSGYLSLIDVGSIGDYPCAGNIGEVSFYEFDVSFRNGVVSAPYYNETMKGEVLPNQGFKVKKKFLYAGLHPTTVTLIGKKVKRTSAVIKFIYRFISSVNPQQGCVWTYKGSVTRVK